MNDKVLEKLNEAKALLLAERNFTPGGNTRELSVTLTEIDTAILWRQHDLQIKAPASDTIATKAKQDLKETVLSEYKKGNIVIWGFDGLKVASLKDIIAQPVNGLLYDLNRNEITILKFLDDPKWINDYAMMQVVKELKAQLDGKE